MPAGCRSVGRSVGCVGHIISTFICRSRWLIPFIGLHWTELQTLTAWRAADWFGCVVVGCAAPSEQPLFDFVDSKLGAGESVLIHCLAGAHRAGTAGTACLMHLCAIDR